MPKKNSSFSHKVISLGYSDERTLQYSKEIGLELLDNMAKHHDKIISCISESDVTLIHWWNHPLLYDFLVRRKLPESRIVMWSHVSGFHPPQVFTEKAVKYADIFTFTTPLSFESDDIKRLPDSLRQSIRVVWSTSGVDHIKSVRPKKHEDFNVGYIGTVDYAKIHKNFIDICSKIKIPNVKFIVCGGPNEHLMREEVEKRGLNHKFNFTGHVSNIKDYLKIFDVFGYPLAPHHYGTCDQVIAESMAAGVVPVVLNNRMERYMVKHGTTGIVADNEDGYIKSIYKLYKDKKLKESMSQNAKKHAVDTFSIQKMTSDWEKIFNDALSLKKVEHVWDMQKRKISAADIFIESLGRHAKDFKRHYESRHEEEKQKALAKIAKLGKSDIWQSNTKGTVHNYRTYFPNNKHISFWSKFIRNNK